MVFFTELEWCTSVDIFIKSLLSLQTLIANFILPSQAWSWTQQLKSLVQHTGAVCRALGSSSDCVVMGLSANSAGRVPWMLLASACAWDNVQNMAQPGCTRELPAKVSDGRHILLHSHAVRHHQLRSHFPLDLPHLLWWKKFHMSRACSGAFKERWSILSFAQLIGFFFPQSGLQYFIWTFLASNSLPGIYHWRGPASILHLDGDTYLPHGFLYHFFCVK